MIYVLDGGAPGKVAYFSERLKRFPNEKLILLDNKGDKENKDNIEFLLSNCRSTDKIIIISEYQLNYIQNNIDRYKNIVNNMIYLRSNKCSDVNYLASKDLFIELPTLGKGTTLLTKSALKYYLNNPKYIIKEVSSTGSNGVIFNGKYILNNNEVDTNKIYIAQEVYELSEWDFYSVPSIIKNNKLTCCIPLSNYERFNSVVHKFKVDANILPRFKESFNELIEILGLMDGVCEPEFVVNKSTKEVRIIDLNPRWSLDCSTSTKIINEEYDEKFDFLNCYFDGYEFFPDHDSSMYYLGRAYYKM